MRRTGFERWHSNRVEALKARFYLTAYSSSTEGSANRFLWCVSLIKVSLTFILIRAGKGYSFYCVRRKFTTKKRLGSKHGKTPRRFFTYTKMLLVRSALCCLRTMLRVAR